MVTVLIKTRSDTKHVPKYFRSFPSLSRLARLEQKGLGTVEGRARRFQCKEHVNQVHGARW